MIKLLMTASFSVLLAGGAAVMATVAFADDPATQDQTFFAELERQGLHFDYDKQICGSVRCEPLRDLLVQEGHAVCTALADSPRLVPASVIANLEVSPDEARAIIGAARQAYCPATTDPYTRNPYSPDS